METMHLGQEGWQSLGKLDLSTLRELFRHLQAWRALWESEGVDVISSGDRSYCLQDIEYLYGILPALPKRQWQAIELCLVRNLKESDAAVAMGISPTNPVSMYAASGLRRILEWIANGELPGWDEILPQHLLNGNTPKPPVILRLRAVRQPAAIDPRPRCPRKHLYGEGDIFFTESGQRLCRSCVDELFRGTKVRESVS